MSAVPAAAAPNSSSWFQRYLLPGFAFKAVVIGGGYATGRELAEFFLPSGPQGGLLAIVLAMLIWSIVCAVTFALAYATSSWITGHSSKTCWVRAGWCSRSAICCSSS